MYNSSKHKEKETKMPKLKEHIRKILNNGTNELWTEMMWKCTSEEIADLDTIYSEALDDQVIHIEEQMEIEMDFSVHELNHIIKDFIDTVDMGGYLDDLDDLDDIEEETEVTEKVEKPDESHEPIDWDTNIKKDFTY
jgi:DNA-directed RNA polymerase specialized sigma54-like protein